MKPRTVGLIVLGGVAVGAVIAAVVSPLLEAATPVPPASASATTVAKKFWHAAEHRDCATMRALSDPDDTRWCVPWWQSLAGQDPHLLSHGPFTWDGDTSAGETQVQFSIDVRGASGMEDGSNQWGLFLRHTSSGWRVSDEGPA